MDIRVQRTRAMLVEAFRELSSERPLHDISVSDICERSTVRRATFYRHFVDKQDFFRYYLTTITDKLMEELEDGEQLDDLFEYAKHMHASLAKMTASSKDAQRVIVGGHIAAETLDMVVDQVADGIIARIRTHCAREGITPAASPEFIGLFYSAGLVHMLRRWISEGQPISVEELEGNCTAFLEHYLSANDLDQ